MDSRQAPLTDDSLDTSLDVAPSRLRAVLNPPKSVASVLEAQRQRTAERTRRARAKARRGARIVLDRIEGLSFTQLGAKYQLSRTTCRAVCRAAYAAGHPQRELLRLAHTSGSRKAAVVADRATGLPFKAIAYKYAMPLMSVLAACHEAFRAGALTLAQLHPQVRLLDPARPPGARLSPWDRTGALRIAFDLTSPCMSCPFQMNGPRQLSPNQVRRTRREVCRGQKALVCVETDQFSRGKGRIAVRAQYCAGALILLERRGCPTELIRIAHRLGFYDPSRLDASAEVYCPESDPELALGKRWGE